MLTEKYVISNHQGYWNGIAWAGYIYAKFYDSYDEAYRILMGIDIKIISRFCKIEKVFVK